jgi:hypothetical protein
MDKQMSFYLIFSSTTMLLVVCRRDVVIFWSRLPTDSSKNRIKKRAKESKRVLCLFVYVSRTMTQGRNETKRNEPSNRRRVGSVYFLQSIASNDERLRYFFLCLPTDSEKKKHSTTFTALRIRARERERGNKITQQQNKFQPSTQKTRERKASVRASRSGSKEKQQQQEEEQQSMNVFSFKIIGKQTHNFQHEAGWMSMSFM